MTGPRVLLVLPPGTAAGRKYAVTHQPIVAAYLAGAAKRADATVTVVDAMLEGLTARQVADRAAACAADVVAVVPFEYRRELTLETSVLVAEAVRDRLPDAGVAFLNGVETAEIAQLQAALERDQVDFVAIGDSEDAFEETLRSGWRTPPVPGILTRRSGHIIDGGRRPATDLDRLAFPDWTVFRWREYSISSHRYRRLPLLPVLASRACPFQCDFCPQALFNTRQQHRVRSAGSVFAEMHDLAARYGVKEIEFYDPTFATRRDNTLELCSLLAASNDRIAWTCNSRCDLLDDDVLAAMKRAGCYRILFGIESGDQAVVDGTGKRLDLGEVRRCFSACRRHGIETIASFMLGLPGDTPETIERTIRFSLEIDPTYVQYHLVRAVLDKSRWKAAGRVEGDWEVTEEGINGPPYVPNAFGSHAELRTLHRRAYLRFYGRPGYIRARLSDMATLDDVRRMAGGGLTLLKQLAARAAHT